jgi:hypothetical protein
MMDDEPATAVILRAKLARAHEELRAAHRERRTAQADADYWRNVANAAISPVVDEFKRRAEPLSVAELHNEMDEIIRAIVTDLVASCRHANDRVQRLEAEAQMLETRARCQAATMQSNN